MTSLMFQNWNRSIYLLELCWDRKSLPKQMVVVYVKKSITFVVTVVPAFLHLFPTGNPKVSINAQLTIISLISRMQRTLKPLVICIKKIHTIRATLQLPVLNLPSTWSHSFGNTYIQSDATEQFTKEWKEKFQSPISSIGTRINLLTFFTN